jgi:hypothetical protein
MRPHRTTDRTLKLSGNKVVVPIVPEVYDKDDVIEEATQEFIERMEKLTKGIIRNEIAHCVKAIEIHKIDKNPTKVALFEQRLKDAQECLDYHD